MLLIIPYSYSANTDGGYHTGKYSFDLFTHQRSTMTMPNWCVCAIDYIQGVLNAMRVGWKLPYLTLPTILRQEIEVGRDTLQSQLPTEG
jgi:hypothetical protein